MTHTQRGKSDERRRVRVRTERHRWYGPITGSSCIAVSLRKCTWICFIHVCRIFINRDRLKWCFQIFMYFLRVKFLIEFRTQRTKSYTIVWFICFVSFKYFRFLFCVKCACRVFEYVMRVLYVVALFLFLHTSTYFFIWTKLSL